MGTSTTKKKSGRGGGFASLLHGANEGDITARLQGAKGAWMRVRKPLKLMAEELRNPNPLRKELPSASPLQRLQADLFDQRRFAHQKRAKDALDSLGNPDDTAGLGRLRRSITEISRNRYVEMAPPAPPLQPLVSVDKPSRKAKTEPRRSEASRGWRVQDSVWRHRPKWANSGSFFDGEAVYDKAFSLDWSRALRTHKLAKFILNLDDGEGDDSGEDEDLDGDGIVDSEVVEVGNALWKHHTLLYAIFDCFASMDAKKDISSVTYNAYKFFVQDCSLDVSGSRFCDSAHYDQLFIMINSVSATASLAATGRRGDRNFATGKGGETELVLDEELVGRRGSATNAGGVNTDKRALCRHEWFNCLVRMAIMRYVRTKEERDVSRALERLLLQDVVPNVDDWVAADHQAFRREVCYTELVDEVLVTHQESLLNIFSHFSDSEGGAVAGRSKKEKNLMKLPEWIDMMRDLNLLDDYFTARDATVVFVLSRMRVVDEQGGDPSVMRMENLSLEDWYEALCRVACLKALPTDEEIVEAGCQDAGEFLLRLQEQPSDYDEWIEDWNEYHNAAMVKAEQPPHRCLTHLIMLMVRTIEATLRRMAGGMASTSRDDDLVIDKREMKQFGRAGR